MIIKQINGVTYVFNCSYKQTNKGLIHICNISENGFIIHSESILYKKNFIVENYKYRNIILKSIENVIKTSKNLKTKNNLKLLKEHL